MPNVQRLIETHGTVSEQDHLYNLYLEFFHRFCCTRVLLPSTSSFSKSSNPVYQTSPTFEMRPSLHISVIVFELKFQLSDNLNWEKFDSLVTPIQVKQETVIYIIAYCMPQGTEHASASMLITSYKHCWILYKMVQSWLTEHHSHSPGTFFIVPDILVNSEQ